MSIRTMALCGASVSLLSVLSNPALAVDASSAATAAPSGVTVQELVVTAQKREQNIQSVGISITAATGANLQKLGVTNTEDLQKIVPGFTATPNYYGTNVFTIRGVGFQDTSLAGSPTVSVYVDEQPLPFSALTKGASLDLQRVEVLKGPQGTLFGENATGGAINYIANKPSDHFEAGFNASYGRFNDADISGYINGPVTDTLDVRVAARINDSGAWQNGYAGNVGETLGGKDFINGRISALWKPTSNFKALLSINGWHDTGYTQEGQLFGIAELSPLAPLSPAIANYPLAAHNDQSASWNQCVNVSPLDPIAGQAAGTQIGSIPNPGPNAKPTGPLESEGPGSVAQSGGQPTDCVPLRRNQWFFNPSLRMDLDLGNDVTLTSLTQVQKFNRSDGIDAGGMAIQDYQSYQRGKISDVYQEVRISGKWGGKGNWIIGANFEHDNTWDSFLQTYNGSSASPTIFLNPNFAGGAFCTGAPTPAFFTQGSPLYGLSFCPNGLGGSNIAANDINTSGRTLTLPSLGGGPANVVQPGGILPIGYGNNAVVLGPTRPEDHQTTNTYAVYVSGEYPILQNLNLEGGVRFTQENKTGGVCGNDGGDGEWAEVAYSLQGFYVPPSTSPAASPPGTCASTGAGPTYNSPVGGGLFYSKLDQNNVAWKVGLNWKPIQDTLVYANISQGYKGGSYPTVALASLVQTKPVVQEGLLAYEVGFKSTLLDHQLQFNAAGFYYDYTNKQILGAVADVVYGSLPSLVNVPKSHVEGFEFSTTYTPEWFRGLTLAVSGSFQKSKVDQSSKNTCAPPPSQDTSYDTQIDALGTPYGFRPGEIQCQAGHFYGFDAYGEYADFTGESFPQAPEFQLHADGEYDWKLTNGMTAFFGASLSYTSSTNSFFVNRSPTPAFNNIGVNGVLDIFGGYVTCNGSPSATPVGPCPTNHPNNPLSVPAYTLVDLRLGIERDNWSFQIWGRNVGNTYYWTAADHVNDTLLRYTGQPATYGATLNVKFR